MYVIDSADKDRLNTAKAELASMLQVIIDVNDLFESIHHLLGGRIEEYDSAGTCQ